MAVMAFAAGVPVSAASAADPYDVPWCMQGKEEGYPGYCGFQTLEQCRMSASGRQAGCRCRRMIR
nr:DUF3551 domain-containing protein [Bradyrhizobium lablabi]